MMYVIPTLIYLNVGKVVRGHAAQSGAGAGGGGLLAAPTVNGATCCSRLCHRFWWVGMPVCICVMGVVLGATGVVLAITS